ncbi:MULTISPECIES: HAD family hydrolase [unclassified Modestobacter]|uniref:HAD family hydrolase n=1 Tax=unclassified Modestobacter TaxID=2643866 RepID=UPI0022AA37D3|nr:MULTISPECIES: HAD family phosphatase [unclassified Modestobacter]MCZ2825961.1 HAD family phosphatase [Modestobacter sp. VKM Ac-2981]MCZ2852974.1 HAD family phosphatase [Modestobacter sp. VKM Ac-2982]
MSVTSVGNPSDSMQSLQAVLFDMDGTLVETEELWGEAMAALAGQLGGVFSAAAREQTVGTSMRVAMGVLYADLGIERSEEQRRVDAGWVEEQTAVLMTSRGMPWRPGARDLLVAVRDAGLATALVTTTPRRIATLVIDQIAGDLGGSPFDLTVCGDEVPARKPDPAPYLQAMRSLGVDPAGSVVIEDSQVGVTAGLASGATVLGVPSLQSLEPLPGLTLRSSLVDLTVAELRRLVEQRELAPTTA